VGERKGGSIFIQNTFSGKIYIVSLSQRRSREILKEGSWKPQVAGGEDYSQDPKREIYQGT